jgi:small subunit ribosomal protein S2
MPKTDFKELLDAGVHFGHLKRKWNPKMAPYIFMERNGIHIIDLQKTAIKIDEAAAAIKQIAKSGRKVLFVATKKQAKDIVAEKVSEVNMPYVTERWPGGMLTNFPTIRKAVKKMSTIDKMLAEGTFNHLSKRERLQVTRQRAKLEKNLGSIADLTRLPAALFVVDVQKEYIAVSEATKLNIPVFAMVDTCCDPTPINFIIPSNDDASKSISLIVDIMVKAINEGLEERKIEKDKEPAKTQESQGEKPTRTRARKSAKTTKAKITPKDEKATTEKKEKPQEAPAKKEEKTEKPVKAEVVPAKKEEKTEKKVKAEAAPAKEEGKKEKKEKAKVVPAKKEEKIEKVVEAEAKEEKKTEE